jgi:hypothetical protein
VHPIRLITNCSRDKRFSKQSSSRHVDGEYTSYFVDVSAGFPADFIREFAMFLHKHLCSLSNSIPNIQTIVESLMGSLATPRQQRLIARIGHTTRMICLWNKNRSCRFSNYVQWTAHGPKSLSPKSCTSTIETSTYVSLPKDLSGFTTEWNAERRLPPRQLVPIWGILGIFHSNSQRCRSE